MVNVEISVVLDVAIGLSVMYLMLSLIGTACGEFFATVLALRAKSLANSLEGIIDDEDLKRRFYDSGIVDGVQSALNFRKAASGSTVSVNASDAKNVAGKRPSYLSSDNFALAILNSVDPTKPLPLFAEISRSVQLMSDSNIRDVLLANIAAANGDLDNVRQGLANWFDSVMDRVSGLYKRDMQYITFAIGVVIAVALNADSISVCEKLWVDKDLRGAVLKVASDEIAKTSAAAAGNQCAEKDKTEGDKPDNKLRCLFGFVDDAAVSGNPLPIGWGPDALPQESKALDSHDYFRLIQLWSFRAFGWLITGLAISFGAPFWFDILSKFMNFRGAGAKPDKAADT